MKHLRIATALLIGSLTVGLGGSRPASAITAELAKKCRAMAFKAYPAPLTGSKSGNSGQMRAYYTECISKNGEIPEPAASTPKPTSRAPSQKLAPDRK